MVMCGHSGLSLTLRERSRIFYRWQSLNRREKQGWAKAKMMKKKEGKLEYRIK